MNLPIVAVLALTVAAGVLLISGRLRPDLVALLLLVVLGLAGLVAPGDLFSGFSRTAVITVLSLFIISGALERTGATRVLGQRLGRLAGSNEARAVPVVMIAASVLSLFMNTIASTAVLLPAVIGITRNKRLPPSKLLIPLAFGSLLGGMATLFTTANILVSAALVEQGLRPYSILEFLPIGLPLAAAGILYMTFFGRRLLPTLPFGGQSAPDQEGRSLPETYGLDRTVREVYVTPGSPLAGCSVAVGGWGERLGLNVVGISRGGAVHLSPPPGETVLEGDVVIFTGSLDAEDASRYGLLFTEDPGWRGQFVTSQMSLVEVVLAPRAALAGKTLREIHFRDKFDLTVLALWREGTIIRDALAEIPLRFGDALLVHGLQTRVELLRRDPDFLVLIENSAGPESPRHAWLAVGLTLAAVALAATNVLPIAEAAFGAATLMVLFNCLTMDDAYDAIEWRTIFLIAGMIPLGLAMGTTGAAAVVGQSLVNLVGGLGPLAAAGGIFVATTVLAQVMGGQATAVVLAPVAIAAARTIGADPRGLAMAVAMGCSTAFLTPFAHPSNLLVMGPAGYNVRHYARVGLPLTLVLFVVLLVVLALVWHIR